MRNTLFISPSSIKDSYTLVKNLDTNFITPYILLAQERDVMEVLGKELYEELQLQIENENISVLNTTLLNDYISSYLMFCTFDLMVEPCLVKLRNSGVVSTSGEYTQTVSHTEAVDLKSHYNEMSNFYKGRLVDYLHDNNDDYPLYHCSKEKHTSKIGIV